jgi:integrase
MESSRRLSFLFFIKRTKSLKNGEVPIYLRITIRKEKVEFATHKTIAPELWSPEKGGAKGVSAEAKEINTFIDRVKSNLFAHERNLWSEGKPVTARTLKNAYLGINPDEKFVIALFEEHNANTRLLKGKDFSVATVQRYNTCLIHLKNYVATKFKAEDLPLSKVDYSFIKGLEMYLKIDKSCNHNTTWKYIKNFKKIIKIAMASGWLKVDPFANIKMRFEKVDRGYLTEEELQSIIDKHFSIERLELVKDCFIFGCFTGLAYSDIKGLTAENLVNGEGDKLWIHTRRMKTNNQSHIPVLPIVAEILDKYRYHPHCIKNNVLLPMFSNQKLNAYLKEIADLCGIKKDLTSHIARHTFATTVTLNNNVPIESVSKMLGHSSLSITKIYARLLDKKVNQDMLQIFDKYSDSKAAS